jgi:integrase
MSGIGHRELLQDGKVLLFERNGIFQARYYKGERSYIYKSLKTSKLAEARERAVRFLYEMEFRKAEELPLQKKTFNDVIDEYIATRQRDYDRGLRLPANASNQQHTSIYMLRQIKRVAKFWREYCGKTAVDKIDNAKLREYIGWRKDYYSKLKPQDIPKNAKLHPADKTLEWETTLAKTLLKFAHEQGYRGKTQLPTWRFKAAKKIVRPAFAPRDLAKIISGMRTWIKAVPLADVERRYTRELLRDYVAILGHSGMRVGEANNLKMSDVIEFEDGDERKNYQFHVKGKTGKRVVIPRTSVVRYVEMVKRRNRYLHHYTGKLKKSQRKTEDKGDWFFRMFDGNRIITLIDQFQAFLKSIDLAENRYSERYTLYSLRHFYAVRMIQKGIPIYDISRNMGARVDVIEDYYGKSATPITLATRLGD